MYALLGCGDHQKDETVRKKMIMMSRFQYRLVALNYRNLRFLSNYFRINEKAFLFTSQDALEQLCAIHAYSLFD